MSDLATNLSGSLQCACLGRMELAASCPRPWLKECFPAEPGLLFARLYQTVSSQKRREYAPFSSTQLAHLHFNFSQMYMQLKTMFGCITTCLENKYLLLEVRFTWGNAKRSSFHGTVAMVLSVPFTLTVFCVLLPQMALSFDFPQMEQASNETNCSKRHAPRKCDLYGKLERKWTQMFSVDKTYMYPALL